MARRDIGTVLTLLAVLGVASVSGQSRGGYSGGDRGMGGFRQPEFPVPRLPGEELDGPPDSNAILGILDLNPGQMALYVQRYDSFMVFTKPQRDSARVAEQKMNDRLDGGDRAAATFYAERLQHLGDYLKDRQERFEKSLGDFLTKEQQKQYHEWKDSAVRAAQERNKEAALRWQSPVFATGMRMGGGTRGLTPPSPRTGVDAGDVASPALGGQAVRVGRAVYVSAEAALDSTGTLVGRGDLRAQAVQAFANVTAVLRAAGLAPSDAVALRIYVVGYQPEHLAVLREAAGAYLSGHAPPSVTVLGVQALAGEGQLIAVEATAVAGE